MWPIFDDGKPRLELYYFGVAHTIGDAICYLPNEKIVFTGDTCVNGPYNYMGDGNSESWLRVLDSIQKLDFEILVPGHGPLARNGREVLAGQKQFFVELRRQIKSQIDGHKSLDEIRQSLSFPDSVKKWVGRWLPGQIEQVHKELTGEIRPLTP